MTKTHWQFLLFTIPMVLLVIVFRNHPGIFLLGTIELGLVGLVISAFVIIYSRRNWRANPYGRALMYSKVSLALIIILSMITSFLGPDWEWRAVVRVLMFGGILVAQVRLLWLLFLSKDKVFYSTSVLDRKERRHLEVPE